MAMAVLMLVAMVLVAIHVIASPIALEDEDVLGRTVMTPMSMAMMAPDSVSPM